MICNYKIYNCQYCLLGWCECLGAKPCDGIIEEEYEEEEEKECDYYNFFDQEEEEYIELEPFAVYVPDYD